MGSFTSLMVKTQEHSDCRLANPHDPATFICLSLRLRFCLCATKGLNFVRLENLKHKLRRRRTTTVAPRVLTGMATPGHSFFMVDCLLCSAMNWWKASWTRAA